MKDIDASLNLQLQIIAPYNHHNRSEIWTEFIQNGEACGECTNEINSIDDFGTFYTECLQSMRTLQPDTVLCLGDRWEMLAAATAALLLNITIAHLHGGEATTGSFDNEVRNSITQMATYHFAATKPYAKNIYKLTGSPHTYNVGSPGLDWLTRSKLLSKDELQQRISITLNQPFIIACLHPVTKELERTEQYAKNWIEALYQTHEPVIFIQPNIDPENDIIRKVIKESFYSYDPDITNNWCVFDNLDHLTYLSLLQYAELMVGNSSSGIIESPSFGIPSISVGNRQDGRIKGYNTFTCPCETEAILDAIDRAREWNGLIGKCDNPYGSGNSSKKIVEILEDVL